jgi:hypothetical protein
LAQFFSNNSRTSSMPRLKTRLNSMYLLTHSSMLKIFSSKVCLKFTWSPEFQFQIPIFSL